MRLILLSCFFLSTTLVSAQSNIAVGGPAPDINVTGWLANVPEDQKLKGNFLVLEFWATWCGPCLAAVPHLNELQDDFGRSDVRFVSITDEPAARTEHLIERLAFKSIVVTDTTKQTQVSFGDGEKGLEAFPLTVLIDRSHIVRWIGAPDQLTEEVMESFLADEPIAEKHRAITEKDAERREAFDDGTDYFFSLFKDAGLVWHLDITEREDGEAVGSMQIGDQGYYNEGVTLAELFVELLPEKVVILPEAFKSRAYTVYYINKTGDTYQWETLTRAIGDELNLDYALESSETPYYNLTITDRAKLNAVDSKFSSTSEMGDERVVITNYTLSGLGEELRGYSDFNWSYTGEDDEYYAFIIDTTSDETIAKSLAVYGIEVQQKVREAEVVRFTER